MVRWSLYRSHGREEARKKGTEPAFPSWTVL